MLTRTAEAAETARLAAVADLAAARLVIDDMRRAPTDATTRVPVGSDPAPAPPSAQDELLRLRALLKEHAIDDSGVRGAPTRADRADRAAEQPLARDTFRSITHMTRPMQTPGSTWSPELSSYPASRQAPVPRPPKVAALTDITVDLPRKKHTKKKLRWTKKRNVPLFSELQHAAATVESLGSSITI